MIRIIFDFFFSGIQFYRKNKGGTWYKISFKDGGGVEGDTTYWTDKKPTPSDVVTSVENY